MDTTDFLAFLKQLTLSGDTLEVREIPIALVSLPAGGVNRNSVAALVEEFKINGAPVEGNLPQVEWNGSQFIVTLGRSRILAARLAGLQTIHARVFVQGLKEI